MCYKIELDVKSSFSSAVPVSSSHYQQLLLPLLHLFCMFKVWNMKCATQTGLPQHIDYLSRKMTKKLLRWNHAGGSYRMPQKSSHAIFLPIVSSDATFVLFLVLIVEICAKRTLQYYSTIRASLPEIYKCLASSSYVATAEYFQTGF